MALIQFTTADRASFPSGVPAASGPLVYQESDSRVRYGGPGAPFSQQDSSSAYYGGYGNYTTTVGNFCETTIEAGYTRLQFQGINSGSSSTFDVLVNGNPRGSGDQRNTNLYFDLANLVAGDIVRFVKTANGGGLFFVDQFTQLPS